MNILILMYMQIYKYFLYIMKLFPYPVMDDIDFRGEAWLSPEDEGTFSLSQADIMIYAGWWLSHPSEKYESQLGLLITMNNIWKHRKCSKAPTGMHTLSFLHTDGG